MWSASNQSLSDESLLAGVTSGDADCVTAFVRRFQRQVFGVALKLVGDHETAEEVAQEAFVRAWRYAGAYDPRRGGVRTWLLAITRNVAIDARRFRRVEPVDPDVLLMLPVPDDQPGPEEQALTQGVTAPLRDVLAALPEEQRRALVLAAVFGCTAGEISASECIPLGTAKTRIRSAMVKLRAALEVKDER